MNINFYGQVENKQIKHIAYKILTSNKVDVLNLTLKLVDTNNNKINFIIELNFIIEFLA